MRYRSPSIAGAKEATPRLADERIVGGFLRGEREAVAAIDEWIARAASPFRRRLSNDWDDVVQEVRLEVLRLLRAGRYRGESSLRTYLWQVAAHTCIDALRRLARRPVTELEGLEEPLDSAEPSPLDRVLEQETELARVSVLEAVPAECRQLWSLILNGLSYQEISRQMQVSEGALRVRAHRCRKRAAELARCNATARADAS